MALSDATIQRQSGPGINGNEGVLCIPQSSSITGISPSDRLASYQGHLWGVLLLCRGSVGVFYSRSRLGHWPNELNVRKWSGRPGFNSRSSHIRDSKNGT